VVLILGGKGCCRALQGEGHCEKGFLRKIEPMGCMKLAAGVLRVWQLFGEPPLREAELILDMTLKRKNDP